MEPVDTPRLAEMLKVLANGNRLDLLHQLRTPRPVRDIELHPLTVGAGENPERAISQQAVRDHLAKLSSIGVVRTERAERAGHLVDAYVLDHARLFAIVEELGRLGELRAAVPPHAEETIPSAAGTRPPRLEGPRLILVRGQGEGRAFPLDDASAVGAGTWNVGRKRGLPVCLDYDPFVSLENAQVRRAGRGFEVVDVPGSRNGTAVNYERLPPGGRKTLENGDVVTVGRTTLLFRE